MDSVSTVYVFKSQKVKVSVSLSWTSVCLIRRFLLVSFILTVCFLCFRGSRMCSTESFLQTQSRFRCTTPAPGRSLKVGSPDDQLFISCIWTVFKFIHVKVHDVISCYPSCLFLVFVHHVYCLLFIHHVYIYFFCLFTMFIVCLLFMLLLKVLSPSGDEYSYFYCWFIVFYCLSCLSNMLFIVYPPHLMFVFIHHVYCLSWLSIMLFMCIDYSSYGFCFLFIHHACLLFILKFIHHFCFFFLFFFSLLFLFIVYPAHSLCPSL